MKIISVNEINLDRKWNKWINFILNDNFVCNKSSRNVGKINLNIEKDD